MYNAQNIPHMVGEIKIQYVITSITYNYSTTFFFLVLYFILFMFIHVFQ